MFSYAPDEMDSPEIQVNLTRSRLPLSIRLIFSSS